LNVVRQIMGLPIGLKIVENPVGAIGSRIREPTQTVQPWQFGDDASKQTCLWILDKDENAMPHIPLRPDLEVKGRSVLHNGKLVERWSNQTDAGQNRLSPGLGRWKDRARTFPGIAGVLADYIDRYLKGDLPCSAT